MKAILVPVDLTEPMKEVEGEFREMHRAAGIEFCERVNTRPMHDRFHTVMVVEEDGRDRGYPINYRASMICRHPHGIVGPVLLLSEGMTSDGMDFLDVPTGTLDLLKEYKVQAEGEMLEQLM